MKDSRARLGDAVQQARAVKNLSLRKTAELTGITPTYLQKLERGLVGEPSPNILYRLAGVLEVDYSDLMALAGYIVPGQSSVDRSTPANVLASALRSSDLSEDEIEEMAQYLGYLRTKRKGKG